MKTTEDRYLVDRLFPVRECHLWSGPSGAGKTILGFQTIQLIQKGEKVFGEVSHPEQMCYVGLDRSYSATHKKMRQAGVDLPLISGIDSCLDYNFNAIVRAARKECPTMQTLWVDPIQALTPDGKLNDYRTVQKFLNSITYQCQQEDITVIGYCHATKVKEGERFLNLRQRILGSVAWGGYSYTVMLIEPINPEDPTDSTRYVHVLPQEGIGLKIDMEFDKDGHLVPLKPEVDNAILDLWLGSQKPGMLFKTEDIVDISIGKGISRSTVERWLRQAEHDGKLTHERKGWWKMNHKV